MTLKSAELVFWVGVYEFINTRKIIVEFLRLLSILGCQLLVVFLVSFFLLSCSENACSCFPAFLTAAAALLLPTLFSTLRQQYCRPQWGNIKKKS